MKRAPVSRAAEGEKRAEGANSAAEGRQKQRAEGPPKAAVVGRMAANPAVC